MTRIRILPYVLPAILCLLAVSAPAAPPSGAEGPDTVKSLLQRAGDRKLTIEERMEAAKKASKMATAQGDTLARGHAQYALAQVEWDAESLGDALERSRAARRLLIRARDSEGALRALRRSGDIFERLGDYADAMDVYVKALHEAEALLARSPDREHRLAVGHIHVTIGNVLRRTGDRKHALAEYRTALRIYKAEGYELGCAGLALNIGNLLADQGYHTKALPLFEECERLGTKLGNPALVSMALTNMASSEVQLGRLSSAGTLLERSFAICNRIGRTRGNLHNQIVMGDLLAAANRPKEAIQRYETALRIATTLHDRASIAEIHGLMADVFHTLGEDARAFSHLVRQRDMSKRILDAEEAARISGLHTAYEAKRREAQIALLQQRESAQRVKSHLLAIALGAVTLLLIMAGAGTALRARGQRVILRQKNELERAYVRMEELSRTDELTGLPNRRDALLRLTAEVARSQRTGESFGLGIADIDGFKEVNDRFGHQTGDRLLTGVAQAVRACLREPDYVARWGGDEFLLILSAVDAAGLRTTSGRIHAAVSEAETVHPQGTFRPTLSCGFVLCRGGRSDNWLQLADEALYRAKSKGRNVSEIVASEPA
ncbi:MAG: GGDEF domain-containing protein [Acidobacteria bacterium]|nr:GGDEF domain-containing protein [Acidobacteriota bacterium]